jgi:hypothetical protein
MSNEKPQTQQYTQQAPVRPQADSLDAQYKPIGISAVTAALQSCHKKDNGGQMG